MPIQVDLDFFLVQNQEGKFFRAKGFSGRGESWVDEASDAKIYTKLGQARSRVTFFANNYPEYGIPKIILVHATTGEVLEEVDRVNKSILKKKKKEVERELRVLSKRIQAAELKQKDAREDVAKLVEKLAAFKELNELEDKG